MGVVYQVRAHCNCDRTCNSLDKPRVLNNWLKYSADECFCSSFEDISRYAPAKSVKQSVKNFPIQGLLIKVSLLGDILITPVFEGFRRI